MEFDWKELGFEELTRLSRKSFRYWRDREGSSLAVSRAMSAFYDWVEEHIDPELTEKVTHFEDYVHDHVRDEIEVDVTSGAFGYEYGSISGVHDPGPCVDAYWEGEGEGLDLDIVVPDLPVAIEEDETYVFYSSYYDDEIEVEIEIDTTDLEVEKVEVTDGETTVTMYYVTGLARVEAE